MLGGTLGGDQPTFVGEVGSKTCFDHTLRPPLDMSNLAEDRNVREFDALI